MRKGLEIRAGIGAFLGLLILILDGKTALEGASEGIDLCIHTLIPTLLPFFFLSNILTGSMMGRKIGFLRPIGRLCRIPEGAEYILLAGFLGGYPLGAKAISQAYQEGGLSQRDGRRMLAFCNNCGPAFLFGISAVLFEDPRIPWLLLGIQIISAFAVALLLPGQPEACKAVKSENMNAFAALWHALRSAAVICGWVVLFRSALRIVQRWVLWRFSPELQVILAGILELSNGCLSLTEIVDPQLRFLLCISFMSFGGLCVTMQTLSVCGELDTCLYFPGKVVQTIVALFIGCLICEPKWSVLPGLLILILSFFLRKREKSCRNPRKLVV